MYVNTHALFSSDIYTDMYTCRNQIYVYTNNIILLLLIQSDMYIRTLHVHINTCITHIIQFRYIWHGVIDLDRADRINSSLTTTTALHHVLKLGREGQGNECGTLTGTRVLQSSSPVFYQLSHQGSSAG